MLRSERSSAALASAQENRIKSGRRVGRRRLQIDRDQIRVLRTRGRSYSQIAEQVSLVVATVRRECLGAVLVQAGMACGNAPCGEEKGAVTNSTSAHVHGPGADARDFAQGPECETRAAPEGVGGCNEQR